MLDGLDQFKLADTTTFDLCMTDGARVMLPTGETDPEGEAVRAPVTITVRRMSSRDVQLFLNKRKNVSIRDIKRKGKVTAESLEDDAVALLTFCVTAWTNFRMNGNELPCTPDNVSHLLANESFVWIREDIDRHVGDDSYYTAGNS